MSEKKIPWKRLYIFEILLLCGAACVLALGYELWYDEAFSAAIVRHSFSDIVSYTASDVHPPLYYFILKLFSMIFGERWVVYHMVSVLPFILMLLLVGNFCKKRYGYSAALLTVLILASAPQMLCFALEVRMYSWAQLFVVLSAVTALSVLDQESWKKWMILSLSNVLAAYLNYFAGAAVILISLCLLLFLIFKREKKSVFHWIISMLVTFLLYLPWLPVFWKQLTDVRGGYWIEGIRASTLQEYANFVFGNNNDAQRYLLQIVFILAVCAAIVLWERGRQDIPPVFFGMVFFGFVAAGIALSVLITPVFVKRYIIIVLPLFWIALVSIFCRLKNKWCYIFLGLLGVLMFTVQYQQEFDHRVADKNISTFYLLQNEMEEGDVIYSTSPYLMAETAAYFPEVQQYIAGEELEGEAFQRWDEMINCEMVEDAASFCEKRESKVWLLIYEDEENTLETFEKYGYQIEDKEEQTLGWDGWWSDNIQLEVYYCTLD